MNLANPAPKVEPAVADELSPSSASGSALAESAKQTEAPIVESVKCALLCCCRSRRIFESIKHSIKLPETLTSSSFSYSYHLYKTIAVEPAVAHEDNRKYAPDNVLNPQQTPIEKRMLSVKALRGEHGADFESYAGVLRGAPDKNCLKRYLPCLYDERDYVAFGEVKKYVLIKGTSIFVYMEDHDLSPLYAIPLDDENGEGGLYAIQEDPNNLDPMSVTISPRPADHKPKTGLVTVLLKYNNTNKQAYQFTFDTNNDRGLAKRFIDAIEKQQTAGKTNKGGGGPITASVLRADQMGKEAKKYQPEI